MFDWIKKSLNKGVVVEKSQPCKRCYDSKMVRVQHGYFSKLIDCPLCGDNK